MSTKNNNTPIQVQVLVKNKKLKTIKISNLGSDLTSCLIRMLANAHINILKEICSGENIEHLSKSFEIKKAEEIETEITITREYSEYSWKILNALLQGIEELKEVSTRDIDIKEELITSYYAGEYC